MACPPAARAGTPELERGVAANSTARSGASGGAAARTATHQPGRQRGGRSRRGLRLVGGDTAVVEPHVAARPLHHQRIVGGEEERDGVLALSRSISSSRRTAVPESRLAVGSSASTTRGRLAMARATATRCCCPPLISSGRLSPRPSSSTSRSRLRRARGAPGRRRPGAPSRTPRSPAPSARESGCRPGRRSPACAGAAPRARPVRGPRVLAVEVHLPFCVGVSRAPNTFSSVVLPEPEGPESAVNSPSPMHQIDVRRGPASPRPACRRPSSHPAPRGSPSISLTSAAPPRRAAAARPARRARRWPAPR